MCNLLLYSKFFRCFFKAKNFIKGAFFVFFILLLSTFPVFLYAQQIDHFNVAAPNNSSADSVFFITVTAIADDGSIFTSYNGTITFSTSSGLSNLPADYTFQPSDAGVHVFAVQLMSGGDQSIIVTDNSTGASGSAVVTITGGNAASLTISAPATASAGQPFYITVIAKDLYNNVALSYSDTVHFTSTDPSAVLPPDATFQRDDNGQEILSVTMKTEGTQTINGQDLENSSISGVSNAIAVSSGIVVNFSVSAPTIANPGTNFNFAVNAMDAYGNVVKNYNGTVHFASSDGAAVLPANYAFQSTDYGSRIFPVTLNTTGNQTISVNDASAATINGTSNNINVLASGSTLYSQPLLLTSNLAAADTYEFVYVKISTPTFAIPANTLLQYNVFIPPFSSDFNTGTEFAGTWAGGQMRDYGQATQSYIIDQNGIRCHPSMDLSAYADSQWYHRTFNIGALSGSTCNQAELAQDTGNAGLNNAASNKQGTFNAVFDNIVFTNAGGGIIENFFSDNNTIPFNGLTSINGTTPANQGNGGISVVNAANNELPPTNNYIWIVKSLSVTQTPIGDVQVGGQYVTIAAQLLSVGATYVSYALVQCTSNRSQDIVAPILSTANDTLAVTNVNGYAYNLISSTAAGPAVVTVKSAHLTSMITINFIAGPAIQADIIPNTISTQTNVSGTMLVEAQDSYGNVTITNQNINISANTTSSLLFSGDNGTTWHNTLSVSGLAPSNILIMDSTAETSTVYAAAAGLSTGTANVYVNNAQATSLVIQPAASTTQAGVGSMFTVQAKDANNNDAYSTANVLLVSALGTMMFSTDNVNYSSTLSVTLNDGSANAYYRDTSMSAMPVTVTASSSGLTGGKAYETIVPNTAAILEAFSNYYAVAAGQWVTITAVVTDAYGNPIQGQWVTATAKPTAAPAAGVTTLSNTTNASGQITLYFKTSTTNDTDNYCIVNSSTLLGKTVTISGSGGATALSILPSPYSVGAGKTGTLYINTKDAGGYTTEPPANHTTELVYLPAGDPGNVFQFSADGINWATSTAVQLNTDGASQPVYVKSSAAGSYIADVIDENTVGQLTATNDTITVTTGYYVYVSPSTGLTATAGAYVTVTAWIVDQNGNPQALQNVEVSFATSNGSVSPVIVYTNAAGQASTGLTLSIAPYAQQVVTVNTSNPNAGTITAAITSIPVITFDVSLPATATEGTVVQAVVRARDAYGETITNYIGTVNMTSSAGANAVFNPSNYTFKTQDAGVKVFNVTFSAAGTWTVTAADSVNSSIKGTSNNIIIYANPTPTPTSTPTKTQTLTKTPTPTFTSSPTITVTFTNTPTFTISPTSTSSPTSTASPTSTVTPTITHTSTITQTSTISATFTVSPTFTGTPTVTETWTSSPTVTGTFTLTSTYTYTSTFTITPTFTITLTSTISQTSTISPTCTITQTETETYTLTETLTASTTLTMTPTETETYTGTETITLTNTLTISPTIPTSSTITETCTVTPTAMFTFRAEPEGSSHVFPQPASTTLNIVYGLNEQANVSIYIYNAAGTPVAQLQDAGVASDYNKVTLDLSGFSPGVYFYIIKAQASGREIKFNLNKFMVAK